MHFASGFIPPLALCIHAEVWGALLCPHPEDTTKLAAAALSLCYPQGVTHLRPGVAHLLARGVGGGGALLQLIHEHLQRALLFLERIIHLPPNVHKGYVRSVCRHTPAGVNRLCLDTLLK